MSYKGKIISELSDVAFRWISSVASKLNFGVDELDPAFLKTLKNLDIENPDAFDLYDAGQLYSSIQEVSEGFGNLGIMIPKDFRNLAADLDFKDPKITEMVNEEVLRKVDDIENNIPRTRGMPYLQYVRDGDGSIQIVGHDGRHFNRALEHLGRDKSLIRFIPDNVVGLDGTIRKEKLLTDVSPNTRLRQQQRVSDSVFAHPNDRGALKDIIKKFLAVPAAVGASGALSEIPNGVE